MKYPAFISFLWRTQQPPLRDVISCLYVMSYTAFLSCDLSISTAVLSQVYTCVLHLVPVWVINCRKMEVILQSYSLRSHVIYGDGKTKAFFLKEHHHYHHYRSRNFGLDPYTVCAEMK